MSAITHERIAELEAMHRNVADVLVSRGLHPGAYPDTAAALRELQQLRRAAHTVVLNYRREFSPGELEDVDALAALLPDTDLTLER